MRISAGHTALALLLGVSGCASSTSVLSAKAEEPIVAAEAAAVTGTGGRAPASPSFTVVASGDVLLHEPVSVQARRDGAGRLDYRRIMRSIRPVISGADLAICHLETPLAPAGGPFSGYPVFSVPPQIVPTLKDLGYDTCSTASNHTLDKGTAGVARTLKALDAAGIRHTGSARSAAEARRVTLLKAKGVPVAQLSYTYGFNGFRLPAGRPWTANAISAPRIIADARRARAAGAKVVIVSLHWGTEYSHAPNAMQLRVARKLLASPAVDLIVGHHAHVVQPIDRIGGKNGKYVAYGMGNLLASQQGQDRNEGLITRFTFTKAGKHYRVTKAEFVPTFIDQGAGGIRLYDVLAELRRDDLPERRRHRLQLIADRTAATVGSAGTTVPFADR